MYNDICLPLCLQAININFNETYKLEIFTENEGLQDSIEDIYFDFLTVVWEFLKWSGQQLQDNELEKLRDYRYKTCLIDRILYKLHKYGIDEEGIKIDKSMEKAGGKKARGKKAALTKANKNLKETFINIIKNKLSKGKKKTG